MPARESTGAVGIGATIGVTYSPAKAVTLAAAYESKSLYQSFEFDVPAHTTPFGQPVPGGTEKLDFDQPMVATVGAAVRPLEGLLLAADVEWIDWSDTNGADLPAFASEQPRTGYMAWNLDWEDQLVFKIGAQYLVPAVKGLAVRAGYNYGKMPLAEGRAFENVAFPAIAEHHFTVGAGYDFGALTVNVAGQYSPEATLEGADPEKGIVGYEARMSQLAFDLGVAYRF
jgi:long-chain fatty acid transport protein